MATRLNHLKKRCAGCERQDVTMNKEHLFPRWLIQRTGTHRTGIRWGEKHDVPALSATIPLCIECNSEFGRDLENPTSKLFDDIENNRGLSDDEAELLIRWMWKIQGLAWIADHPYDKYSVKYTLRERVLFPIDEVRCQLVLGMALIRNLHSSYTDLPMGIDSSTQLDAIFVSGVCSKIAMMVVLERFQSMIPTKFGCYHLAPEQNPLCKGRLFYPPISFQNDVEAVGETTLSSGPLSMAHDKLALELQTDF
jgi:hypothetical protein